MSWKPRHGLRRPAKAPKPPLGDLSDPAGLPAAVARFLEWLRVTNYAAGTVANAEKALRPWLAWCHDRGLTAPREVTKPILERYQRHLYHYRSPQGKPLSFRSQRCRLAPIRKFFQWLAKRNEILYNPAADLELPKPEQRLPKHVLTVAEAEQVLARPDVNHPLGLRDRAMLETFYSTGIRRSELIGLRLYDLDRERGTLLVRQGKGKKDRMIPIGARAVAWVEKYLADVRPRLVLPPDEGTLFLNAEGLPLAAVYLTDLVREYVLAAELGKSGSCHLFRHTMATLMLENGADIRFIQAILGHAKLSTTEIYTQVSIRKLKEIHTATHPARWPRPPEPGAVVQMELSGEALLARLEAEAED